MRRDHRPRGVGQAEGGEAEAARVGARRVGERGQEREASRRRVIVADPGAKRLDPARIRGALGRHVDARRERAELGVRIGEERDQPLEGVRGRQGVRAVLEEEQRPATDRRRSPRIAGEGEEPGRIDVEREVPVAERERESIDAGEGVVAVAGAPELLDDRVAGAVLEGVHPERGGLVAIVAPRGADRGEEPGPGRGIIDAPQVGADRRGADDRRLQLDLEFGHRQPRTAARVAVDVERIVALAHRDVRPRVLGLVVAIDDTLGAPAQARGREAPGGRVAGAGALEEQHGLVVEDPRGRAEGAAL